jgi:hypothetical protein
MVCLGSIYIYINTLDEGDNGGGGGGGDDDDNNSNNS